MTAIGIIKIIITNDIGRHQGNKVVFDLEINDRLDIFSQRTVNHLRLQIKVNWRDYTELFEAQLKVTVVLLKMCFTIFKVDQAT